MMMIQKTGFMLMLAGALILPNMVFAEQKMAVIDVVKVLNSSTANQRAEKELAKKRDEAQAEIDRLEKPILEKQQRLRERRSAMNTEQFEEEEAKLRLEIREYRGKAQGIQEGLQREALKKRKVIADMVDSVVDDIAKEKGYTMVLPMNITVYTDAAIDISDAVLEQVNQNLK